MKKRRVINILISIAAVFIVLFTAEIIMRFAWEMGGWVKRPIYRKSHNAYLRYELIPNAKSERISINSDGFRGPEYPVPKPAKTLRIIMLGDSETFSFMLKQEESLASQLEKILNERSESLHYEVLNFGVEGYNTFQELEQLKHKGLKYSPDLIILNYCLNDPEPGEYYFDKNFFVRHSALARYFSYRIKKSMIKAERKRLNLRTEVDHYYYLHQPKYFSRVENAISEIADIASVRGIKLILVIFPTSSTEVKDFKESYPYRPIHKLIKNIQNKNIVFVDLIEEFNHLSMGPREASINYEYNESHKNPPALGVSANFIFNTLKSNKLIPD
ncbi:MAG: hypothetical protein AABY28_02040 [Candidatus Omnitrophota bacterium]